MSLNQTTCYYANNSNHLQVARIANVSDWYFERIIFPGQRLMFDAPVDAHLEIYIDQMDRAVLANRIPCVQLQVQESRQLAGSASS
ncbi:MAG: DUF1830 domain-containing protein [Cyanobacteria bacterium P01_A01_bin.123]